MKNNFVICGCVKNCEPYLDNVFSNIKKIVDVDIINVNHIIFSFDISKDKPLLKLQEFQKVMKNLNIDIIINKNQVTRYRTINIMNARNLIMDKMKNIHKKTPISHFIMMDLDDVTSKEINIEGLKTALMKYVLNSNKIFDCVTFSNEQYYDFWALSLDEFHYSCWHTSNPYLIMEQMKNRLYNSLEKMNDYIECDSAFNGFGIYKYNTYESIKYESRPNIMYFDIKKITELKNKYDIVLYHPNNILDCEHRMFHYIANKKYGAKNIIVNINLFPKYDSKYHIT